MAVTIELGRRDILIGNLGGEVKAFENDSPVGKGSENHSRILRRTYIVYRDEALPLPFRSPLSLITWPILKHMENWLLFMRT